MYACTATTKINSNKMLKTFDYRNLMRFYLKTTFE